MHDSIRHCKHCGEAFTVEPRQIGDDIECPFCQGIHTVFNGGFLIPRTGGY